MLQRAKGLSPFSVELYELCTLLLGDLGLL